MSEERSPERKIWREKIPLSKPEFQIIGNIIQVYTSFDKRQVMYNENKYIYGHLISLYSIGHLSKVKFVYFVLWVSSLPVYR